MLKHIKNTLRPLLKTRRGVGYPGDGKQSLRIEQIERLSKLMKNKDFINHYPELLLCNEAHVSVADKIDVSKVMENYFEQTKNWQNYRYLHESLKSWDSSVGEVWPNIHTTHRHVVDACVTLGVANICDVGAGAGSVSKFIAAETEGKGVKLTCLEGSDRHIEHMRENFNNSDAIVPKIKVTAEIVKGFIQNNSFKDGQFDMVFSCTVLMHMPYMAAVLAIAEMTRISSRYVLYVDGYHIDGIPKYYKNKYDRLLVDYEALHQKLGYKTIRKEFHRDPYSKDYEFIVYLAEKIK